MLTERLKSLRLGAKLTQKQIAEKLNISQKGYSYWENGQAVTGEKEIDGNTYFFAESSIMQTSWQYLKNQWYYFNPVSDGTKGIMFANRMTPDGWFVREDGSWDEKR